MEARTYKRVLVLFDVHVPHEDKRSIRLAAEFARDFKPHIVVAGGDWQNMDSASIFAGAQEDETPLKREYARTKELIELFKVTHYLEGNHEERISRLGGKVPKQWRSLLHWREHLDLDKRGIISKPYHNRHGVFKFGKLSVLHGFWCPQYAARKHAEAYGCCLFGHTHRHQVITPAQAFERNTGFNCGCLCKLDMPWVTNQGPRGWIQGFFFFYLWRSGQFNPYDVRLIGRDFIINGKQYRR